MISQVLVRNLVHWQLAHIDLALSRLRLLAGCLRQQVENFDILDLNLHPLSLDHVCLLGTGGKQSWYLLEGINERTTKHHTIEQLEATLAELSWKTLVPTLKTIKANPLDRPVIGSCFRLMCSISPYWPGRKEWFQHSWCSQVPTTILPKYSFTSTSLASWCEVELTVKTELSC